MNVKILNWFEKNKRILPWRQHPEPYHIWICEIIMQQTKIAQGLPYYLKFIANYPTVFDLAKANEEEVLNLWQGLGYYSRARNLHYTAKDIVENYDGVFPKKSKDLLKLKGIGDYTAAAIASICHREPVAVLDGNVFRVLSRLYNIHTPINSTEGKKEFKILAQNLIHIKRPDLYNQGIMELGALVCKPKNPDCPQCPVLDHCLSFENSEFKILPKKNKKAKSKNRFFNYFQIEKEGFLLLNKRTLKDIWLNLYDFPMQEVDNSDFEAALNNKFNFEIISKSYETKHILSHQKLHIQVYKVSYNSSKMAVLMSENKDWIWAKKEDLKNYPFPKPIESVTNNMN